MKKPSIIFTVIALWGCSGGSGLTGDGSEDAPHDTAPDAADAADGIETIDDERVDVEWVDEMPGEDMGHDPDAVEDPDMSDLCLAQDAHAGGPCGVVLPGVKWDGEHCVGMGSGCSCEGSDCGSVYDTMEECVEARRPCYDADCDPDAVAVETCFACSDPRMLGAFWDGRECFELTGCGCVDDGCDQGFASIPECEAVMAGCDGALCRATGGKWFPMSAGFCGLTCGIAMEFDCAEDSCDCGPGKTFFAGVGCDDDASCTPEQYCLATRGRWHPEDECYCGFTCGRPNDCEACADSCDCGPHRTFDPEHGCLIQDSCPIAQQEDICASTGGRWHGSEEFPPSCGHYFCGVPNMLDPCVMPGCDCGAYASFDEEQGCVYYDTCVLRRPGQDCLGLSTSSTCRPGLVCCSECGMPPGCSYCRNPCCPDIETCKEDGCLVPPP